MSKALEILHGSINDDIVGVATVVDGVLRDKIMDRLAEKQQEIMNRLYSKDMEVEDELSDTELSLETDNVELEV